MVWPSPPWDEPVYWSLDLETGGLDVRRDPILAVGMVPIRAGAIRLGEAFSTLVRPEGLERIDPHSMIAHQLVPRDVREAPVLRDVLWEVDRRVKGAVLLVHQSSIDITFLRRGFKRSGLRWPEPVVVDTVSLILKAAKRARFVDPDASDLEPDLNLLAARRAHGLPEYSQHDALNDAIATAELFLVLRRAVGARTLRDLR